MKQFIININVETKKNTVVSTNWLISRDINYNYIERGAWRKSGNLIADTYRINLLKPDIDIYNLKNDNTDFAGFVTRFYNDKGEREALSNESLIFRGRSMGEIFLKARIQTFLPSGINIFPPDYTRFTKGEREFLAEKVYPHISQYIREHSQEMYNQAVIRSISQMEKELHEYKENICRLESEKKEIAKQLFAVS